MSLIQDFINELNNKGMIQLSNRALYKDNLGLLINEFKEKEFKKMDDSFLIGFYEGFRSETGIPTDIQKISNHNNNLFL